jgi:hypothetical protein
LEKEEKAEEENNSDIFIKYESTKQQRGKGWW